MKRWRKAEPLLWHLAAALLVIGVAAAFYVPALLRAPGVWPAPLDDVYIHYGFARSAALGRPFQWIPGNGYSSGGTSLTYPLVLAPGYLLGFRSGRLGVFAAIVACVALLDLCRSARELVIRAGADGPRWVAWVAVPLLLSVPLLDWSLFSGMETALFDALLGRAAVALRRVELAPPERRAREQLRAGLYGMLLVATRPESIALAVPLGIAVAHAGGSLGVVASLARGVGPSVVFLGGQALVNRALTSEWSAAGAVRKLLTSDPYSTPTDVAVEVLKNLIGLRSMALESALGRSPYAAIVPLLGLAALLDRRSRRLAAALLVGAGGALVLVSLNATARFQNLRYAAPSIAMLLLAALLGVGFLARRRAAVLRVGAAAPALAAVVAPWSRFPSQIDHFARASANIAEQQVEVAARLLARRPRPRVVLVGDAGAIPYFSGVGAIDGLGLGGYRGMPFARASVHGVPAVVELIERLDPSDRPDVLALYPSWWVGLADVFGRPVDAVRIEGNVICAADEKVIYEADWSALALPGEARPGAVFAMDVADLVEERAHAYRAPGPRGGWVIGAVLEEESAGAGAEADARAEADAEADADANAEADADANAEADADANAEADADAGVRANAGARWGRLRFDAGRIVPEGREESFELQTSLERGPATLVMRTDPGGGVALSVHVLRDGRTIESHSVVVPVRPSTSPPGPGVGRWFDVSARLKDVRGGDRVRVFAARGAWRSFHFWLLRP